ncbi:DUF3443 domain-containing protein [Paraburkholderia hayleyella]|uniref:DUF3443 domain-containing protein n=1 Tax=Paraburkholderia hayleyella TaxID=2152889 RepID=UPI0012929FB5|nr:DUF3443 domain-containing protein [Paraburkholderia hayleyella]
MLFTTHFKQLASVLSCAALLSLAACGGSDGNSNNSSGGGNGIDSLPAGPTMQPIAATASNTVPITVNGGVNNNTNIPTVSVTVCAPGSNNCQKIDNVVLDTGSYGLRIVSSVLTPSLSAALPRVTSSMGPLAECATFATGYAWGSVRTADVKVGGESASGIPVQITGDLPESSVPANGCVNGPSFSTVQGVGANGILGVGVAPYDCGPSCFNVLASSYYACSTESSCAPVGVPLAQQVANPVLRFAVNNNGVIVQLPPVPNRGVPSVAGTLVFGINTQPNNMLNGVTRLYTDPFGNLTGSRFNGKQISVFVDSGSNGFFFEDASLQLCQQPYAGFYCPSMAQTRNATFVGKNGTQSNVSFNIANASVLFENSSNVVFNNLAGKAALPNAMMVGLPFFFGRYVYYGMDRSDLPGGNAPYIAF